MIEALLGSDALLFQRPVLADELPEVLDLVGGVMESGGVRGGDRRVRLADDGEPVLRAVPGKEADRGVAQHDLHAQHLAVPVDQRLRLGGAEHDVRVLLRPESAVPLGDAGLVPRFGHDRSPDGEDGCGRG